MAWGVFAPFHPKLPTDVIVPQNNTLLFARKSLEVSSRECPQAAAGKRSGVGDGKGAVITHFNVLATSERI